MIDVEDTGIGIPADKLEEVFKPFVQVDSRQTAEKEGSGIGLTIVKRIMDLMGGVLTVESVVGQGTVFHLQLANVPVSERLAVGDHAEPGGAVDFNDFAPATLLVADDHQANRELIAGIFEKTHHRVQFASNGQEALESLEKTKPDVVLLDIRMPVMDGRTTLAEIRKRPNLASLPVIAITASGEASADPEGRSQFSGFIRKPFSRHTLFIALAPFLQRAAQKDAMAPASSAEMAASIPGLRRNERLSGGNSRSNCATRKRTNGRVCETAWRLMARAPLPVNSSTSLRPRNAARWPLTPPRSPRLPTVTRLARWNVILPRSRN